MDGPPSLDSRACDGKTDAGTEVVEVALAVGEAGRTMIPADYDERVFILAGFLKFLNEGAQGGVEGGDFSEVVGQVLPDCMNIRQECGHLALEVIRVDVPELLTGALHPLAVDVGGAEPVGEGLAVLACLEEALEVGAHLLEQLLLGGLGGDAPGGAAGHVLGEAVELPAVGLEGVGVSADPGIPRSSRRPHLVGVAQVVARILQQERPCRNIGVPDCTLQYGSAARFPEVPA